MKENDKYQLNEVAKYPNSSYILVICVSPLKESFETIAKLFLFNDLQEPNKRTSVNCIKRYIEIGNKYKDVLGKFT